MRELHCQQRGLQRVEAEVSTHQLVIILRLRTVRAEQARPLGQRVVVGHEQSRVAECAEVFRREETVGAHVPDGPQLPAAIRRAHGLRGVLDDEQVVLAREREHLVHRGGLAEEMHRDDGLRARRDAPRGVRHIEVEGERVSVYEHWLRAHARHTPRRREEGVARTQHLVARPDVCRHQCQQDRIGAGGDADGVLRAGELGDGFLELRDFFAKDELSVAQHALEGDLEFGFQREILRVEVK